MKRTKKICSEAKHQDSVRVGKSGGQHNQVQMCGQFLSDGRCVENNE